MPFQPARSMAGRMNLSQMSLSLRVVLFNFETELDIDGPMSAKELFIDVAVIINQ
jgi:hypothetical protein